MNLDQIGFYTQSEYRAAQASATSPLWRCELILTDKCNFKCSYCRGLRRDIKGTLPLSEAQATLDLWIKNGLKNVRFSGGEPTLYPGLIDLVKTCASNGVERIAVSTNGSADWSVYEELLQAGVNDFSISLDSCRSTVAEKMAGGVNGSWDIVTTNINKLAKRTYTTVGVVINEDNISTCVDTAVFADCLGVKDIRIIPSAQYNRLLEIMNLIPEDIINKYPILKYRVARIRSGRNIRGLVKTDSKRCWLAMDDMAVANGYHFPCIIYMREKGDPIGKIGPNVRYERAEWAIDHNCQIDPICKGNCLDVCIDYNNRVNERLGA